MSRTRIALEVRAQLGEAEQALVAALEKYEKLGPGLEQALKDLGVTGTVGQSALARIQETVEALRGVESLAIETHAEYETLRVGLGFRHVAGLTKWWTSASANPSVRAA